MVKMPFGCKVIRITDAREGEVFKPTYSFMPAWNAGESILTLGGENSVHVFYHDNTCLQLSVLDIVPSDLEEVCWSHADPDTFYYISRYSRDFGFFKRCSVEDNEFYKIRHFYDICGKQGFPAMETGECRPVIKEAKRSGYKAYIGEPHATISHSGARIVSAIDWYDSASVNAYVIELPAY